MQPIKLHDLNNVRGGFGALLGTLAQSAGPILNGVAGIIGASKSGGRGGGGGGGQAPAPAPAPSGPPPSGVGGTSDPLVSVSVTYNGVAAR